MRSLFEGPQTLGDLVESDLRGAVSASLAFAERKRFRKASVSELGRSYFSHPVTERPDAISRSDVRLRDRLRPERFAGATVIHGVAGFLCASPSSESACSSTQHAAPRGHCRVHRVPVALQPIALHSSA